MMEFLLGILSICTVGVAGFYVQPEVPEFSMHPRSQIALGNASISLTCSLPFQNNSTDLPHPQIHWVLNGTNISEVLDSGWISITTNDSSHLTSELNISSISLWHAGYYQCLAKDGMTEGPLCSSSSPIPCVSYNMLSSRAWIQLITYVDLEPEERYISVPGSVLLECGSTFVQTLRSDVAVEWRMNGTTVATSTKAFLLDNGDLMVYMSESGQDHYDCFISTTHTESQQYRSYTVTSTDQTKVNQTLPKVAISSTHSVALVGDSVQLVCSVFHGNSSSNSISWNGRVNISNESKTGLLQFYDTVLNVDSISVEASGRYCCEVGGVQSCTDIAVTTEVLRPKPLQIFIDFQQNITHCVNMTCSIPESTVPINWFRNAVELNHSREHQLVLCSSDPYQLYGTYQCSTNPQGDYDHVLEDVGVVARVLPYGITNPIGRWNIMELPQISSLSGELYLPVLVSWDPPGYVGNLLSIMYKVVSLTDQDRTTWNTYSEAVMMDVTKYSFVTLRIEVQNQDFQTVSSERIISKDTTPLCETVVLYPPQILNVSCNTGSVLVDYVPNSNNGLLFISTYPPEDFYFKGNCTVNETLYMIQYEKSQSSPFSVGGGMTFLAGTTCTLAAANTPSRNIIGDNSDKISCYDVEYLEYSEYQSCVVQASIGFVSPQQAVQVSSVYFEVCVQSRGYGYTAVLSANSSDHTDFEETTLEFNSPTNITTKCINIYINGSSIIKDSETMALTISTENSFVILDDSISIITIDNDVVMVLFEQELIQVMESVASVNVCVLLEGRLEQRNVTISVVGSDSQGYFNVGMVMFSPEDLSNKCLPVNISDDAFENCSNVTLFLSSSSPAVVVSQSTAIIVSGMSTGSTEVSMDNTDSTKDGPTNLTAINAGLFAGITIFICLCVVAMVGGCIGIIKIYHKRTRNSYVNFQKELSFGKSDVMEEENYKYLITLKGYSQHTDVDDDNLSQIDALEPTILNNISRTTSPVMSVPWGSLDDSRFFKDSSRLSDSEGYINHLDSDEDKLLAPSDQELNDFSHDQTRVHVSSPINGNSSVSARVMLSVDGGLKLNSVQDQSVSGSFAGGSSTDSVTEAMPNDAYSNLQQTMDSAVTTEAEQEVSDKEISQEQQINPARLGNDDSGYPHSSQDTDQEEQAPYSHESIS